MLGGRVASVGPNSQCRPAPGGACIDLLRCIRKRIGSDGSPRLVLRREFAVAHRRCARRSSATDSRPAPRGDRLHGGIGDARACRRLGRRTLRAPDVSFVSGAAIAWSGRRAISDADCGGSMPAVRTRSADRKQVSDTCQAVSLTASPETSTMSSSACDQNGSFPMRGKLLEDASTNRPHRSHQWRNPDQPTVYGEHERAIENQTADHCDRFICRPP